MTLKELVGESADVDSFLTEFNINIPNPGTYIYSNCTSFSISQMDIRIGFAEAMPDGAVEPRVGIVLSPEHAAILALMLTQQVHVYEQHFGEIRHPEWKRRRALAESARRQKAAEAKAKA